MSFSSWHGVSHKLCWSNLPFEIEIIIALLCTVKYNQRSGRNNASCTSECNTLSIDKNVELVRVVQSVANSCKNLFICHGDGARHLTTGYLLHNIGDIPCPGAKMCVMGEISVLVEFSFNVVIVIMLSCCRQWWHATLVQALIM